MQNLEPQALWNYFAQICAIPRISHNEDQIQAFIINEAERLKLKWQRDDYGNILIKKPSSAGYEISPVLALQAHLDMVGEKEATSGHNFLTDPIKTQISADGKFVEAENTTLGADNGIGVAAALAILASNDIPHPALEVLFTASEEIGMVGALNLNPKWLAAEKLLNLDSEVLGEICIGCAGGLDAQAIIPLNWQPNELALFSINIRDLIGGHSGIDIHKNRANAIKIAAELLLSLSDCAVLVDFNGGNLRNAICRKAEIVFASNALWADLRVRLKEKLRSIKENYPEEKNLKMDFKRREDLPTQQSLTAECSEKVLKAIIDFPHGVCSWSEEFPEVVENSNNLATVKITENQLSLNTLLRALDDDGMLKIAMQINKVVNAVGGKVFYANPYPAWQPQNSAFVEEIKKAGIEAGVEQIKTVVIHAGLECGLIFEKYPQLALASIGPNIFNPHSPHEKVDIDSVSKFWSWLIKILYKS